LLPVHSTAMTVDPQKLFLFSHTKVGKTTLVSGLPNCLIIDAENGSNFISGIIYNLRREHIKSGKGYITLLKELSDNIKAENIKSGNFVYDYIAIDTVTGLETIARQLATNLYKETVVGKNFKGTDVVNELERGGGYMWLRTAFEKLYNLFDGLAANGLILLGHVKASSIVKNGKDLSALDIDLVGKLKNIISADVDAIGILRRGKENTNQLMVSFKTNERDLATGARPKHLRNQEFILSELKDETMEFHWDKIFTTLKED